MTTSKHVSGIQRSAGSARGLRHAALGREVELRDSIMRGWKQAQAGELKPLAQVRAERDGA